MEYTSCLASRRSSTHGRMTAIGGSIIEAEVSNAIRDASCAYVNMDELTDKAGSVSHSWSASSRPS